MEFITATKPNAMDKIAFENVKLRYLALIPDDYDSVGFHIVLSKEEAAELEESGFNVKWSKQNPEFEYPDDWESTPTLRVKLGKDGVIPDYARIYIVDDENESSYRLDVTDQEALRNAQFGYYVGSADVVVQPIEYDQRGRQGITVFSDSLYLHVTERTQNSDPFFNKYFGSQLGEE